MNTRPPSSPPPVSSTSLPAPPIPPGRGLLHGPPPPGVGGGRRGPAQRPVGGRGPARAKFDADGGGRHSEGSAIDGPGARRGGGGPAGRAEEGEGAAGRAPAPPSPPASEPRERHWLRRSKFSAPGGSGKGRECVCRQGAQGEGRRGRGASGGEGGGGGARPAALRRRHLFVVLKPLPLSSAQLSHNGQLFLAEGPGGVDGRAPHRNELLACPSLHLMPGDQSWGRTGGSWGRLSFVPRELASGSKNKSDAGEVEGRGARRNDSLNKICNGTQKSLPSSLVSRPELPPPLPPPSQQREAGDTEPGEFPHSKNMSTNSKWTPGCSPPFKCSFSLSATAGAALSPLGLQESGSFFPEKGVRVTLRAGETPLGV